MEIVGGVLHGLSFWIGTASMLLAVLGLFSLIYGGYLNFKRKLNDPNDDDTKVVALMWMGCFGMLAIIPGGFFLLIALINK